MFRLLLVVGLVWLALLPPVFTAGACTAEYEAATGLLQANRPQISTPEAALQFLQTQALQPSLLSAEDCARSKPRFLRQCGSGSLVYAEVPVRNPVCRFYRDDATRIQLHYDRRERLVRVLSEMNPYKYLPLP